MRNKTALIMGLALMLSGAVISGASGSIDNDNLADAKVITSLPFSDELDGTLAGLEPGERQSEACTALATSVWYRYTATADLELQVSTILSGSNTGFAVYDAATGELLLCNDDKALGVAMADASLRVTAGTEMLIQVGHVDEAAGLLAFNLSVLAALPGPCDDAACPVMRYYELRGPVGRNAGETNIGVNPITNTAMLLLLGRAVTAHWDEDDEATYKDVTTNLLSTTNDPILWTDRDTGRTFVAQLRAYVGSVIGYTDNDGASWTIAEPGIVEPSWDHQSIGGGPYPESLRGKNPLYENAIYYCAQTGVQLSQCARSDTGGLTWTGPFPMNVLSCVGLHGHIAVSPVTGTVVVPHKSCGGEQGVVVSKDAAHTWSEHNVPGTVSAMSDPAVAFDAAGRLYFTASSDGKPVVSYSDDEGETWSPLINLGESYGIQQTEFPMAVAGDDGRAAVAWYGSAMPGSSQSGNYNGVWHVYVATTIDGGATWQVVDGTPDDPIQRGCIWLQGGSNPCRNLLDFQGMTIDADGRVLVSVADGCLALIEFPCAGPSGTPEVSHDDRAAIIRQVGGPRLLVSPDLAF